MRARTRPGSGAAARFCLFSPSFLVPAPRWGALRGGQASIRHGRGKGLALVAPRAGSRVGHHRQPGAGGAAGRASPGTGSPRDPFAAGDRASPRECSVRGGSALRGTKGRRIPCDRPSRAPECHRDPPERLTFKRPSDRRSPGRNPGPQGAFEVSMINVSCNSH